MKFKHLFTQLPRTLKQIEYKHCKKIVAKGYIFSQFALFILDLISAVSSSDIIVSQNSSSHQLRGCRGHGQGQIPKVPLQCLEVLLILLCDIVFFFMGHLYWLWDSYQNINYEIFISRQHGDGRLTRKVCEDCTVLYLYTMTLNIIGVRLVQRNQLGVHGYVVLQRYQVALI